jgi:acetyl-CoA decarbonylase/synthase complex subunit gamma
MPLSGLDIYKLLPKTNCRECGFVTCLAFAMQLAKKAVSIDKCPYVSPEAKQMLQDLSLPPIRRVVIGTGDHQLEIGNETVMFRHEEKFRHPCGLGFIIDDNLSPKAIKDKLTEINHLSFERVGQVLKPDMVALNKTGGPDNFVSCVEAVAGQTPLALALISGDVQALESALKKVRDRRPLLYGAVAGSSAALARLAKDYNVPLVVSASDLEGLSKLTQELSGLGVTDMVLDTGQKDIADMVWDLTQMRRRALKKSDRNLGYPALVNVASSDPWEETLAAATAIAKYAGLVLMRGIESWEVLPLLTLRQNIYTDPQKPLQIEPKVYSVGKVTDSSPLLVTTNFSLTYYTVLGEVEASKVPAFIMSVDTEGMSVLTAWAAEKFNAEKITAAIDKFGVADTVKHKKVIIPGYVAMMSGDLEEQSGWKAIVGPKEAAGIPSFLKNL